MSRLQETYKNEIVPAMINKFGYKNENYPVSNNVFEKSLSLPIFPDMSDEEIDYVIKTVNKVVNENV